MESYKTGNTVEKSGVYYNDWRKVEILKKGAKFPKDPVQGETNWYLAKYPYSNQITSIRISEEFRTK